MAVIAEERLELLVRGAKCGACLSKIERAIASLDGVAAARFNLTTGKLSVEPRGKVRVDPVEVIETLDSLGFTAAVADDFQIRAQARREDRALLLAMGVAAFGAGNVMMFSVPVWAGLFGQELEPATRLVMNWFGALVATPCALYAGLPFFRSAAASLRKGRANMDVPISIGVILTLAVSYSELLLGGPHAYFDAAVSLLFFLLIGRWLDQRLRRSAQGAARDLLALQAPTARRLEGGLETARPIGEITVGQYIVAAPGERIALDGVVEEGISQLDNALITGESKPAAVGPGKTVHAGALSLTGRLVIRVTARSEDSTVAALARLLEAGAQTRSRYVVMAEKAAALYVPVIHSVAALAFTGGLVFGLGLREALLRAVAVLIVTCPCALGLAAPAVQITASGRLFRKGVLVKSGAALERLAEVDHVVFDKTGVLTHGRPRLVDPTPGDVALAAPLARASRHPLARALTEAAGAGPIATAVKETPGMGIEGQIAGRKAWLGRASFLGLRGQTSETELWFMFEGGRPRRFAFSDQVRDDAAVTVEALHQRGISVEVLSGDSEGPVLAAALSAGIDDARGGLGPMGKVGMLRRRAAEGRRVLMVGDGLNDAAALAEAHASMAPGSAVDASQNAADLVFLNDGLSAVVEAIDVARAAKARTRENFGFAAIYNAAAIPVAVLGLVNPLVAALAMSGSSILVTLNALRLALKSRPK